jgi:hypothetical protein
MDPSLSFLLTRAQWGAPPPAKEVGVLARLEAGSEAPPGFRVVSRFGDVVTGRVRLDGVGALRARPEVASLKASQAYAPDVAAPGGEAADAAAAPIARVTMGEGVVLGVADWGCDFAHANLRNPSGHTRLMALWDQRGPATERSPAPFGYGRELRAIEIDGALLEADPYAALGYDPADADASGQGSHGTHVIDIAAGGGGAPGARSGLAPESDLVFVHLSADDTGPGGTLGDSARLLEAVDYILRLADDRPVVINLSIGRTAGPHDDSLLLVRALDYALETQPGRAIVMSTGNYRDAAMHCSTRLERGGVVELPWIVHARGSETAKLDVWYAGDDRLVVELVDPAGRPVGAAAPGETALSRLGGDVTASIFHRLCDPNNGDNEVEVYLWPDATLGTWTVRLHGAAVSSGEVVHAWIERDAPSGRPDREYEHDLQRPEDDRRRRIRRTSAGRTFAAVQQRRADP